jgi:hypothetical protein
VNSRTVVSTLVGRADAPVNDEQLVPIFSLDIIVELATLL